jgi:hypothetical protein
MGHMFVFFLSHFPLNPLTTGGCRWYDYLDALYWTNLINRFLRDQEVAFLVPPTLEHPVAQL